MKRLILIATLTVASCAALDSVVDTQEAATGVPVTDAQAYAVLTEETEPAVRGLLAILDPLIPIPLQPAVPLASSLLVMAFSRRSRRHVKQGLGHLAKGNVGGLLSYLLRAVGAKHTSPATEEVAKQEEEQMANDLQGGEVS
ncbi:hypothetical protein [Limnobacter sp.]|jgi:hypothetical protein|uniref:hypothetical protein n=1 Tax=Limnobacter sp. TaxID=2003368 RepID=UPI0025C63127|nr:hypothetical protein [Limnobacter sp.]